jgi:class 3 adenylate cyclase
MPQIENRRWVWRFDVAPERLWVALADTARFNEAAGFPKHRIESQPQGDGTVIYIGHAKFGPFSVRWRDLPVEWVTGRRFRHAREFENGPFKSLVATLTLAPEGKGCRAEYVLEVEPANALGRLLLRVGFFRATDRTFGKMIVDLQAHAAGMRHDPFEFRPARLSAAAKTRLARAIADLEPRLDDPSLARRLGAYIVEAPELDLLHLRPVRLARAWGVPERAAIELCLAATRAGLLEMQWDLLCPNCRGPKVSVIGLDRLPKGAHCETCNIDYERDFMRNVELTFRPVSAIRPIDSGEFCLFGPMTTPHVIAQQTLEPGEEREISLSLSPGDYRLRDLHRGEPASLTWTAGGFPEAIAEEGRLHVGAPAAPGMVRMVNHRDRAATLVLESRDWVKDALTAHRAISLQAFRDLFPTAILRPGDEVGIAHVTLMFTDLRGSTALYGRIGDARAYHLVREHFAYLASAVRANDGAVIKTIGDAVMAAFSDPGDAVRAALDVQRNVAAFNRAHGGNGENSEGVVIKLGLHGGACIAVTLNDRLDYFGSTVNLAARLQGQSRGGDIVISQELADDAGVSRLIDGFAATREQASVKGFAAPVAFRRLIPASGAN